jgi:hypothetical protein
LFSPSDLRLGALDADLSWQQKDDARESNMPDVGRRSGLYGVGVMAHDCARHR